MTLETRSSEVRVFERCKRKWFIEKIMKIPQEESYAMSWGTHLHRHLEAYLSTGTKPTGSGATGRAAWRSFHLLPKPSHELIVEETFVRTIGGAEYFGTPDLIDPTSDAPILLYDHKSTARLKYAKSKEELQKDVSANFYAHLVQEITNKHDVPSRWIYTERNGEGVMPVDFTLTNTMIEERMDKTTRSVEDMVRISEAKSYAQVEGNFSACRDYNRTCPHIGKCETLRKFSLLKA